jgi:hypothetical protein
MICHWVAILYMYIIIYVTLPQTSKPYHLSPLHWSLQNHYPSIIFDHIDIPTSIVQLFDNNWKNHTLKFIPHCPPLSNVTINNCLIWSTRSTTCKPLNSFLTIRIIHAIIAKTHILIMIMIRIVKLIEFSYILPILRYSSLTITNWP